MLAISGAPTDRRSPWKRPQSAGICLALGAAVVASLVLTGCQPAILDPQGLIGMAQKTILIDSLAIMLAIVVPTIIATLAFAWWFRASNTRATYLPDWEFSGRIELIVWAIPFLVIMLLGGVAWIGSHDLDPAKPLAFAHPAARDSGRVAGLEVALHLSGPGHREREPARRARGRAPPFFAHIGKRDECLLHPAARQHDLHDERHDDAVEPAAQTRQARSAASPAISAAMASPACISRCWPCRRSNLPPGSRPRAMPGRHSMRRVMQNWPNKA